MSYRYGYGPEPLEVIGGIVLVVLFVIMVVLILVPIGDPVLSEQLDRYELDPTIVEIDTMTCEVNDEELRACTVSIEAPVDLISKARYVRLINPEAEATSLTEGEDGEEPKAEEETED